MLLCESLLSLLDFIAVFECSWHCENVIDISQEDSHLPKKIVTTIL